MPLDPRTHAVRGDLADVRLSQRVFAPHYAMPLAHVVRTATALREARDTASPTMTDLVHGDVFEVLEFTGDTAWGIAPGHGLVGYCAAAALARRGA